jgi:hypothetical protein
MDININIEDYLTPEEIKNECKEAVRGVIYTQYGKSENELDRLLINLSYRYVFNMVDKAVDGNLETIIKEKVIEIINDLSPYCVFRSSDYGSTESKGYKIIEEEVEKQRNHIRQKIYEVIEQYDFQSLKSRISDMIYECIEEKLFGNNNT